MWTKLSDIPVPMQQHATGLVSSKANGREIILTSGLDENDAINQRTYLFNLRTKLWRVGPLFPKDVTIAFDRVWGISRE